MSNKLNFIKKLNKVEYNLIKTSHFREENRKLPTVITLNLFTVYILDFKIRAQSLPI